MVVLFVLLIAAVVLAAAVMARKQPPAPSDSSLTVPVAEDGREIMDIGGTNWIDDGNVVDYGGLYTLPVRADGGK